MLTNGCDLPITKMDGAKIEHNFTFYVHKFVCGMDLNLEMT